MTRRPEESHDRPYPQKIPFFTPISPQLQDLVRGTYGIKDEIAISGIVSQGENTVKKIIEKQLAPQITRALDSPHLNLDTNFVFVKLPEEYGKDKYINIFDSSKTPFAQIKCQDTPTINFGYRPDNPDGFFLLMGILSIIPPDFLRQIKDGASALCIYQFLSEEKGVSKLGNPFFINLRKKDDEVWAGQQYYFSENQFSQVFSVLDCGYETFDYNLGKTKS